MATNVLNFLLIANRHRGRRRPVDLVAACATSTCRCCPSSSPPACSRPAWRSPTGPQPGRDRPARGHRPGLPVPAAHRAELDGAQGAARGPHAPARGAPGRLLGTVLQTLVAARQDDRPPLGGGRALLARDRPRARALRARAGVVHTAGLLHDIGKFIFPDSILFADTRLTAEQFEIVRRHPEQGRSSSSASTATGRSRRSSTPTTSASTAAATPRTGRRGRSRSRPGSSPSPTPTT